MKRFRFQLDAVLRWRNTRLEHEQAKLDVLRAELQKLGEAKRNAEASGIECDRAVKNARVLSALDLRSLDAYRRHSSARVAAIEDREAGCRRQIAEQLPLVVEARRERDLIARLEARKRSEWKREADREMESQAGEIYLSRLIREARPADGSPPPHDSPAA